MEGAVAIVLAAGSGERMGAPIPKALVPVDARPLVARAVERAAGAPSVGSVVVVVPPGFEDEVADAIGSHPTLSVVAGGPSRQASVRAGLQVVPAEAEVVICHDAARALASTSLFERVVAALGGWDGVIPVLPIRDTVKRMDGERVDGTEPREGLALAQTPQAFVAAALRAAHAAALRDGVEGTDDSALLERIGLRVRGIPGEPLNLKITTADDLRIAEAIAGLA